MLVVSDLVDIYAPASSQLLMPAMEYKDALLALLESLPAMWANSRSPESAAVAAIEGAVDLLRETGGKVHAFLGGLPSLGPHALRSRDGAVVGEREKPVYLTSQDNTLRTLAISAADHMICIDLSFLAQVGPGDLKEIEHANQCHCFSVSGWGFKVKDVGVLDTSSCEQPQTICVPEHGKMHLSTQASSSSSDLFFLQPWSPLSTPRVRPMIQTAPTLPRADHNLNMPVPQTPFTHVSSAWFNPGQTLAEQR